MTSLRACRRIVSMAASVLLPAMAVAACGGGRDTPQPTKTGSGGRSFCAAKLTTTARSDGAPQVLYNGRPLYRYACDAKPGDTNGPRLTDFGAAWFAVSGAGEVVSRPASKPGGTSVY